MRVIIAGGRDFNDYEYLRKATLRAIKNLKEEGYNTKRQNVFIVSGKAKGADSLGEKFARQYDIGVVEFPADWSIGKSAGYRRNTEMANYALEDNEIGVLIAFWDKKSRGTMHMIDIARSKGIRTFVFNY